MIKTAFFLAAGLGTRMRPLTLTTPKPMLPVAGKPLMDHLLDAAVQAGVQRAVVNVHYLPEQVEDHVIARTDIEVLISDERSELLETGGAIVKAMPMLGNDPIFVVNTDAFWVDASHDPFADLADAYDPALMDDLLLLANRERSLGYHGKGDFAFGDDGVLQRRAEDQETDWAFAGVRITQPKLYENEPIEPFSANRIWNRSLPVGRVFGLPLRGQWMHVGDPDALSAAERWIEALGMNS